MKALSNLALRVKNLSVNDLVDELGEYPEFIDLIIELNTKNQLYDKGVDAIGDSIGSYSAKTKAIKDEKGQISDHVTLNDTGKFYESFKVYINSQKDFVISADTIKDADDLIFKYGKDILGLNEDSLTILRESAKKILIPYVKSVLLQR
jgi:hypothetical protein